MPCLHVWLVRACAAMVVLCCGLGGPAGAADFREPVDQPFVVWPHIPVVRASDLGDYAQDRKAFSDLHADKADPQKLVAALQAVDGLQAHHENTALAQLGAHAQHPDHWRAGPAGPAHQHPLAQAAL